LADILYCTRIVANASLALGEEAIAAQLIADAEALAAAIHRKFFVSSSSGYLDTRQTHLTMPLISGAVPAEHADGVWAALRKEIMETQAAHYDTGLHGTYFMTKLLTDTSFGFGGGDDMLYAMATVATYPVTHRTIKESLCRHHTNVEHVDFAKTASG
jgi:alpha-L-rhamnosidase